MIYEYATTSWPVALGCDESKPCAARCWAKRTVNRLAHSPNEAVRQAHEGLVQLRTACSTCTINPKRPDGCLQADCPTELRWTGTVRLNEAHLLDPLSWHKPQIVASGYHGDIGLLPAEALDRIFAVSALCPQHQTLFLTKRPERLVEYFSRRDRHNEIELAADAILPGKGHPSCGGMHILPRLPLSHVWIGTSVSDQPSADERLPHLRKLAVAGWNTWISCEPAVGSVDWERELNCNDAANDGAKTPGLFKWLVAGGESGKDARPAHPDWLRAARDACVAAGVPFWFKQRGEFTWDGFDSAIEGRDREWTTYLNLDGSTGMCAWASADSDVISNWTGEGPKDGAALLKRVGKKAAGNLLDGRTWQQTPWEASR